MSFLRDLLLDALTRLAESVAGALRVWAAERRAQSVVRRLAKAEREATENAQTEEERTHAADNSRRL